MKKMIVSKAYDHSNRVKLLGFQFKDSHIVEKILVTVPKRVEATINTLENTKNLSNITLAELLNSLQAQEERKVIREDGIRDGALVVKNEESGRLKNKNNKKNQPINGEGEASYNNKSKKGSVKGNYLLCKHYGKNVHAPYKCWKRRDAKFSKYNQLGHEAIICKSKFKQRDTDAQIVNVQEEDQLFVASCFAGNISTEASPIDRGFIKHMTHDKDLLKDLKPTRVTKVIIDHGDFISVKGI
ncbi:uncharacterized protein [Solanum lycopersicum]|uniref:uncharacterized protein n=1 Tax=Solanum lycopersicum TaxID=4081 RepID=UPI0037498F08